MKKLFSKLVKRQSTRENVADLLERFVSGNMGAWEWDDFVGVPLENPELEAARKTCLQVRQQYPAGALGNWCAPEGMEEIRKTAKRLRSHD